MDIQCVCVCVCLSVCLSVCLCVVLLSDKGCVSRVGRAAGGCCLLQWDLVQRAGGSGHNRLILDSHHRIEYGARLCARGHNRQL